MENHTATNSTRGYDCMKKLLAICSVFLSICATFTGCGEKDNSDRADRRDSGVMDDDGDYMQRDTDPTAERIDDEIDDVRDAGEDIIGGATDAVDDILGGDNHDHRDDNEDDRERHSETDRTTRDR